MTSSWPKRRFAEASCGNVLATMNALDIGTLATIGAASLAAVFAGLGWIEGRRSRRSTERFHVERGEMFKAIVERGDLVKDEDGWVQ